MKRMVLMTLALGTIAAGCHTDMWVQPKTKPQHDSSVFENGMGSRPHVAGTVARGKNMDDAVYFSGRDANNKLVTEIPVARAMKERKVANYADLVKHGQERFEIFCTPCHGQLGDGQGMIATRGLALKRPPANYHTDRLRKMPVGHFFDVMTNGFGVMYSFASRIPVADRWAIASYIRALQRSQNGGVMPAPDALLMNLDSSTLTQRIDKDGRLSVNIGKVSPPSGTDPSIYYRNNMPTTKVEAKH